MARARGANAVMHAAFETTYGTPPTTGYRALPFVSSQLGATRGLIESDLLGQGRSPYDPVPDVTNNDGDVVVPVDVDAIGVWLKLLLGAPDTTGTGPYTHVFTSGAVALPSMSIEIGHPQVPSFATHYGVRGNTMQIAQQRSGLLSAGLGLIAKGETAPVTASQAGMPTGFGDIVRFAQASGEIKRDGTALGSIVGASFSYSNGLEKVETIRPDGEIEDVDPGMTMFTGTIDVLFADNVLYNLAVANTPMALSFGWTSGAHSLTFEAPRVFLPRTKRPVSGAAGIQAQYAFQASRLSAPLVTATLKSPVGSYE